MQVELDAEIAQPAQVERTVSNSEHNTGWDVARVVLAWKQSETVSLGFATDAVKEFLGAHHGRLIVRIDEKVGMQSYILCGRRTDIGNFECYGRADNSSGLAYEAANKIDFVASDPSSLTCDQREC